MYIFSIPQIPNFIAKLGSINCASIVPHSYCIVSPYILKYCSVAEETTEQSTKLSPTQWESWVQIKFSSLCFNCTPLYSKKKEGGFPHWIFSQNLTQSTRLQLSPIAISLFSIVTLYPLRYRGMVPRTEPPYEFCGKIKLNRLECNCAPFILTSFQLHLLTYWDTELFVERKRGETHAN